MIKLTKAYYKKNKAVWEETTLTFLGIPIYKFKSSTTHKQAISDFTEGNYKEIKIKGFKND